jgi:[acyl-carrier-protein] S-malonyltransferase
MSVGFIFPGQGSQSPGMLHDLVSSSRVMKNTLNEASDVLGYDMVALVQAKEGSELNQTEYTQPAMLTMDIALWRLWCERTTVRPAFLAGHSLGEISALVAADALSFSSALKLVQLRGRLMQKAVEHEDGAMAAIIGCDVDQVQNLCDEVRGDDVLNPANFNCPGQVVVSGHRSAVLRSIERAPEFGVKLAKLIPVSVPSHCSLMTPACESFKEALNAIEDWKMPVIKVIHNAEVREGSSVDDMKDLLTKQLTASVRWVESIRSMINAGVNCFIECGPGRVLKGLNRRIDKGVETLSLLTEEDFEYAIKKLGVSV